MYSPALSFSQNFAACQLVMYFGRFLKMTPLCMLVGFKNDSFFFLVMCLIFV